MEATSALSVLSLLDTTKAQRLSFVQQAIEAMKNGESDPLQVHRQVKCVEDLLTQLKDNPEYKGLVLFEAEKHGKKYDVGNATFDVRETGTKYDYSQCNDPELVELQAAFAKAETALKQRQKFLQGLPAKGMDTLTADAELITIYPPSKTSTTSVVVSLK
jgi:uncharacterized protein (DUF736 family)